jgi:hypothetical protein
MKFIPSNLAVDCLREEMKRQREVIERLTAENEALKVDADRYRWLRDKALNVDTSVPMIAMIDRRGRVWSDDEGFAELLTGAEADEAIDAARVEVKS